MRKTKNAERQTSRRIGAKSKHRGKSSHANNKACTDAQTHAPLAYPTQRPHATNHARAHTQIAPLAYPTQRPHATNHAQAHTQIAPLVYPTQRQHTTEHARARAHKSHHWSLLHKGRIQQNMHGRAHTNRAFALSCTKAAYNKTCTGAHTHAPLPSPAQRP